MKKGIKYSIITAFILASTLGGFYYTQNSNTANVEYLYKEVTQGNLEQTVTATGTVLPGSKVSLSFQTNGTLRNVPLEVGDTVKTGDLLGELDDLDLQLKVLEAQANLRREQANLKKIVAGATSQEIAVAEEEVEKAKIDAQTAQNSYANLEDQYAATLNIYKQDIETAKDKLENAKNEKNVLINSEEKEIKQLEETAVKNLQITYYAAFSVMDAIIEIENDERIAGTQLSLNDYQAFDRLKSDLNQIQVDYRSLPFLETTPKNQSEILETIDTYTAHLLKLDDIITRFIAVLTDTIPTGELTAADITTFKATLITNQANVSKEKTSLNTSKASITNEEQLYAQKLSTANTLVTTSENALKAAKNLLVQEEARQNKSLQNAKDQIEASKSLLELTGKKLAQIKAPAQDYEIELQRANIDKALANLNYAENNATYAKVYSPIEGIIVDIPFEIGEKVSTSQVAFIVESLNAFELEVDVPESDISKISVGNTADVTFDAFGQDITVPTTVISVEPAETVIQDIIYYKIKMPLENVPAQIKSGLSADATIFTAFKENTLFIPQRAVLIDDEGNKYVRILENEGQKNQTVLNKNVTTGIKGDGGLIEVKEGLASGEKVITLIKTED